MSYSILADIVAALHLGYVSYVVLGQFFILLGFALGWRAIRNPWFRWSHLLMILVVSLEAMVGFKCPLTTWEEDFRIRAGQKIATGDMGFIGRLVDQIMFFQGPDWIFTAGYIACGLMVGLTFVLVPPRKYYSVPTGPHASGSGAESLAKK